MSHDPRNVNLTPMPLPPELPPDERHETRVERAIRRQVAEEIAQAIETHPFSGSYTPFRIAAAIAREIGAKETS